MLKNMITEQYYGSSLTPQNNSIVEEAEGYIKKETRIIRI